MKLLFIVFSTLEGSNGIAKKIQAQVNALHSNGIDVSLCHYYNIGNVRYWAINGNPIVKIGSGLKASIRHYCYFSPLYDIIKKDAYEAVYIRYIHNATPCMLRFFSKLKNKGVKIFMEIPTFPYDGEYTSNSIKEKVRKWIENKCRLKFHTFISKIITFSDDSRIFNIPTIRISNAVDLSTIECKTIKQKDNVIRLLAVANLSFWHGYDRLIKGIADYYKGNYSTEVHFDFVGGGPLVQEYKQLAKELHIERFVHFHGLKSGNDLDYFYRIANICIGCLGCHRKGLSSVKSLKNIEYAAHGLPMAYSENNSDFDNKPYVIKLPADESNIDIKILLEKLNKINLPPAEIRQSISSLDWNVQMEIVAKELQ